MKKIKDFAQRSKTDLLIVVGALLVAVGVSLIYLPAGLIVGGVLLIGMAVLDASGTGGDSA